MKQAFPYPCQAVYRLALDVQLRGFPGREAALQLHALSMNAVLLTNPVSGVHFERMATRLVQAGVLQGTVPSVPLMQYG